MGAKAHLTKRISQGLFMYSLLASAAAAASLDADVRAGKTYIELQPGTHTFSGANVSGSLTIVGSSAGDTTVECSGAFAVTGALALHNLTVGGCQDCGARLGGVIRTDSGRISLENVNVHGGAAGAGGAFYCGGTGSLALQRVNLTDNTAELGSAGVVDGSCQLHWKHGYADGELLIAGANPQVNLTDVSLSSIHVVAGEDANVGLCGCNRI